MMPANILQNKSGKTLALIPYSANIPFAISNASARLKYSMLISTLKNPFLLENINKSKDRMRNTIDVKDST